MKKYPDHEVEMCPVCGSKQIAPVFYGKPLIDEEFERRLENKEVYLGGCILSENAPRFHCFDCGYDIVAPPVIETAQGEVDLRELANAVSFKVGSVFKGRREAYIEKKDGKVYLTVIPEYAFRDEDAVKKEYPAEVWNTVTDRLYNWMFLHEWDHEFNDPDVMDGTQWELTVGFENGKTEHYYGSNAYPPYWEDLNMLFGLFFMAAGLDVKFKED